MKVSEIIKLIEDKTGKSVLLKENKITIRNVSVGDRFYNNGKKNFLSEVVDIIEQKSLVTKEIIGYIPIAKLVDGLATNKFETTFAGVVRYRVD